MKLGLAALFFITALLYASVGFGGGSTYTALLIVFGAPLYLVPIISLACNVTVVSGNTVSFARARLIAWDKLLPIIAFSVPAAWAGGRMQISERVFVALLAAALLIAGLRLLLSRTPDAAFTDTMPLPFWGAGLIGAGIGFYSGLVGIGGGIFLAPVLYGLKWGTARQIAAGCSLFILVNSLAGMTGQFMKLSGGGFTAELLAYWPLIPAVFVGGLIGSRLGALKLPELALKRLTGILILTVAARLSYGLLTQIF